MAVRRLVPILSGRLSVGCALKDYQEQVCLRSNDAERSRISAILCTADDAARRPVSVSSVASQRFEARYVRGPQSSETEVLGTANIDL